MKMKADRAYLCAQKFAIAKGVTAEFWYEAFWFSASLPRHRFSVQRTDANPRHRTEEAAERVRFASGNRFSGHSRFLLNRTLRVRASTLVCPPPLATLWILLITPLWKTLCWH